MQKIVLATGGTGGHIFPALAVAEELYQRFQNIKVLFIGGKYGAEEQLIVKKGYNFVGLPVKGFAGRGITGVLQLRYLVWSMLKSWQILKSFKPEIVVGFGSYPSFAPVYVAGLLGIKTAIHEQNSFPGMTNRWLGKRVDKILLSFSDQYDMFPKEKTVVVGNPVRRELLAVGEKVDFSGKHLLILGGSQGAKAINEAVLNCLPELKQAKVKIWHQTGTKHYAKVKEVYAQVYPEARVEPFIEDMAKAYGFADLVVTRAGASTVAELIATKRPAVLIPYPYAINNHQLKNAQVLEKVGAGIILMEPYLEEIDFGDILIDLLDSPQKLAKVSKQIEQIGQDVPASQKIIVELEKIINEFKG